MIRSPVLLLGFAAILATASLAASAHAKDPLPLELRTFATDIVGGVTGGSERAFADKLFLTPDAEGKLPDLFDFGAHAPAFAIGAGGRDAFALSFSGSDVTKVRALNFGAFSFGTRIREAVPDLAFAPDSFEDTLAVDRDVAAFVNWDLVNSSTKRIGFDVSVAQRTFAGGGLAANGFSTQESNEVGASLSADVLLTSRLSFTGRAGINLSEDATRAHFDATRRKGTRLSANDLSFSEAETGLKDAYVQGGLSFALTENLEIDATVGYARDLDTRDDSLLGKIGAAWKIRF